MEMADHPGALANWPHNLLVIALLAFLLIVPGWLASGWFGVRTTMDRMGLIPGMSVVMLMLSGIGVLAIWRGSLTTAKGWAVVAVAIGLGRRAALRRQLAEETPRELRRVLQQALLAVLDEGVRRAARRAVPRPGGSGRGAGRDRQVDRLRRSEGLRHLERALGRLPAEGRPVAVHPVHPDLAVHRRVHRPVPASARDVVGEPDRCRDRRGDRDRRAHPARLAIPRRARRPPRSV